MKKIKLIILFFCISTLSCSQDLSESNSKLFSSAIDTYIQSLKRNNYDTIIIYGEKCVHCVSSTKKIFIAFKKKDSCFLTVFETNNNNELLITKEKQLINSGIFLVLKHNLSSIKDLLSDKSNPALIKEKVPEGIEIKKLGANHGKSYLFGVIIKNLDIRKEYCCGLHPNSYFINHTYPLWLLMSAFKLEQ